MATDRNAIVSMLQSANESGALSIYMSDNETVWLGEGTDEYIDTTNDYTDSLTYSTSQTVIYYLSKTLEELINSSYQSISSANQVNLYYNNNATLMFAGGAEITEDSIGDFTEIFSAYNNYYSSTLDYNICVFYKTVFNDNYFFDLMYLNLNSKPLKFYFFDCEFRGKTETEYGLLMSPLVKSVCFHNCVFDCKIKPSKTPPLLTNTEGDVLIFKCTGSIDGYASNTYPQIIKTGDTTLNIYKSDLTITAYGDNATLSNDAGIISDTMDGSTNNTLILIDHSKLSIYGQDLISGGNYKSTGLSTHNSQSSLKITNSEVSVKLEAPNANNESSYMSGVAVYNNSLDCNLSTLNIEVLKATGYLCGLIVATQGNSDINGSTINIKTVGHRVRGIGLSSSINNTYNISEFNVTVVNDFSIYNGYALELWNSSKLAVDSCKLNLKAYRAPSMATGDSQLPIYSIRKNGDSAFFEISDYAVAKTEIYCECNDFPGIENSTSSNAIFYGSINTSSNTTNMSVDWFESDTSYNKGYHYYDSNLLYLENETREIPTSNGVETYNGDIYLSQLTPSETKNVGTVFFVADNAKHIGEQVLAGTIVYNKNSLRPVPGSQVYLYTNGERAKLSGLYNFVIFYDANKSIISTTYGTSSTSSTVSIPDGAVYFTAGVMSIGTNHRLEEHSIVDGYTGNAIFTGNSGERYGWEGEKNNSYSIEYAYGQVPATSVSLQWRKGKWGIV